MKHCPTCNRDYFATPHDCGKPYYTSYQRLADRRNESANREMFTEAFALLLKHKVIEEIQHNIFALKD